MESLEFKINFRSIRYINSMKHLFKFSKGGKPWLFPVCEFVMAITLLALFLDLLYEKSVFYIFIHTVLFGIALKIDFLYLGQFLKYLKTIPYRSNLKYYFVKEHFKVLVLGKRKTIQATHTISYDQVESVLETPLSLQIRCVLPDSKNTVLSTAIFKCDLKKEELTFLIKLFKDAHVTYFDLSSPEENECAPH